MKRKWGKMNRASSAKKNRPIASRLKDMCHLATQALPIEDP